MLYTRKGDQGTTKLFDCKEGTRVSKSSYVFEVLGTVDELNSSLGFAKSLSGKYEMYLCMKDSRVPYVEILEVFQQNLFCIQAELGGSDIHPKKEDVLFLEEVICEVESLLPPIKSFIVPGGGESGAYLDVVRTITRRAERGVVLLKEKGERELSGVTLEYLNRLSSALYALARFANYQEGCLEKKPIYK